MFRINLTTAATAVVIGLGFAVASDMALSRTEPTAAATVSARFPSQSEMLIGLGDAAQPGQARKTDRATAPAAECVREHWPYIADECLSTATGGSVKPSVRTITIERRVAGNVSQLERVTVTDVASR